VEDRAVKMINDYLELARDFEKFASDETDPSKKERLLEQVASYRKLAAKRAELLGLPPASSA
jgi:hypothetical protein